MKINIKATGLELVPSIKTYIGDKIGSLSKFVKKFDTSGQAEAWIEIGRATRHHHKGPVYRAEADLRVPGKILRAEHYDADVRAAILGMQSKLRSEIEKYRTKADPRQKPRKSAQ